MTSLVDPLWSDFSQPTLTTTSLTWNRNADPAQLEFQWTETLTWVNLLLFGLSVSSRYRNVPLFSRLQSRISLYFLPLGLFSWNRDNLLSFLIFLGSSCAARPEIIPERERQHKTRIWRLLNLNPLLLAILNRKTRSRQFLIVWTSAKATSTFLLRSRAEWFHSWSCLPLRVAVKSFATSLINESATDVDSST